LIQYRRLWGVRESHPVQWTCITNYEWKVFHFPRISAKIFHFMSNIKARRFRFRPRELRSFEMRAAQSLR
jgi:hypothetical protein